MAGQKWLSFGLAKVAITWRAEIGDKLAGRNGDPLIGWSGCQWAGKVGDQLVGRVWRSFGVLGTAIGWQAELRLNIWESVTFTWLRECGDRQAEVANNGEVGVDDQLAR